MELRDFSDVMSDLLDLQGKYELSWEPKDGTIQMTLYVGIENTDLLKQGRVMFAD